MAPTHNLNSAVGEIRPVVHLQQDNCYKMNQSLPENMKNSTTLQSVLRGEIPTAYVHLTSSHRTTLPEVRHSDHDSTVPLIHVHREHEHSFRPYTCSSPLRQSQTASPQSHLISKSPKRTHSPFVEGHSIYSNGSYFHESPQYGGHVYERSSPAFEGRSSPFQESGSPFIGSSPHYSSPSRPYSPSQNTTSSYSNHRNDGSPFTMRRISPFNHTLRTNSPYSPVRSATSPYTYENSNSPYSGSQGADDTQLPVYNSEGYSNENSDNYGDQPIDLSCKSELKHDTLNLSADDSEFHDSNGSLLRTLLRSGKQVTSDCGSDSGRDSPGSDVYKPDIPVVGSTRVTLAKKMVYPITSRVSDWLVKIVQFSKSIPEFQTMSQNDKMTLLLNSWTRMLLLLMAENDYEFAVTPLHCGERLASDQTPTQDEPTMKSVEGIQTFIRKCKNMNMDQKEYALMRMAVLFNSGMYRMLITRFLHKESIQSARSFSASFELQLIFTRMNEGAS